MEALIVILHIYLLVYVIYIARLIFGFSKVDRFTRTNSTPTIFFSIVVPFRNEEKNLPQLLDSIKDLSYPKDLFEFIFVDDDSTDNSQSLIYKWRMANGSFNITLINNVQISGSPKKDAILRASMISVGEWTVTTDADCNLPQLWLQTFNDFIRANDVEMIAAPVVYKSNYSFREQFQQADFLSLQGATIGSFGIGRPFMCNGANLAYTKELFLRLNGFDGIDLQASGDDVFLLQKAVNADQSKVQYLMSDSAIVTTKPENSWRKLFQQRVRWASKATTYQSEFGENLALVVFCGNLSFIILATLFFLDFVTLTNLIAIVVSKFGFDAILMYKSNSFLRKGKFFLPILSSFFYPVFSVGVAIYSITFNYEWKGRKYQ